MGLNPAFRKTLSPGGTTLNNQWLSPNYLVEGWKGTSSRNVGRSPRKERYVKSSGMPISFVLLRLDITRGAKGASCGNALQLLPRNTSQFWEGTAATSTHPQRRDETLLEQLKVLT